MAAWGNYSYSDLLSSSLWEHKEGALGIKTTSIDEKRETLTLPKSYGGHFYQKKKCVNWEIIPALKTDLSLVRPWDVYQPKLQVCIPRAYSEHCLYSRRTWDLGDRWFPFKLKDLHSDLQHPHKASPAVVHLCNVSAGSGVWTVS